METPEPDFAALAAQYASLTDPADRAEFLRKYRQELTGFTPADDANEIAHKVRGASPVPATLTRGGLEDLGLKPDAGSDSNETPDFL
jgi:hypothetical protein